MDVRLALRKVKSVMEIGEYVERKSNSPVANSKSPSKRWSVTGWRLTMEDDSVIEIPKENVREIDTGK